jgi:hypothetical protein
VQKHTAEWSVFNALAYLTPALVVDTILGESNYLYHLTVNKIKERMEINMEDKSIFFSGFVELPSLNTDFC